MNYKDYPNLVKLLNEIYKIDEEAGHNLKVILIEEDYHRILQLEPYGQNLDDLLFWANTNQGHDYWSDIHQKWKNKEFKYNRNNANSS